MNFPRFEVPRRANAKPAKPAKPRPEISNFSNFSSGGEVSHKPDTPSGYPVAGLGNPEHDEAISEHLEERAAIMEHDGGLCRPEADREARRNLRVFTYRLEENPGSELYIFSPGTTLDDTRRRLEQHFGKGRVLDVKEREVE